jgi:hypothetical protein
MVDEFRTVIFRDAHSIGSLTSFFTRPIQLLEGEKDRARGVFVDDPPETFSHLPANNSHSSLD